MPRPLFGLLPVRTKKPPSPLSLPFLFPASSFSLFSHFLIYLISPHPALFLDSAGASEGDAESPTLIFSRALAIMQYASLRVLLWPPTYSLCPSSAPVGRQVSRPGPVSGFTTWIWGARHLGITKAPEGCLMFAGCSLRGLIPGPLIW